MKQFRQARFHFADDFLLAFGVGECSSNGIQIGLKLRVGLLFHVEQQACQLDVNGLIHDFLGSALMEFTECTKASQVLSSSASMDLPAGVMR